MKKADWIWMPHAAHLCVGHDCSFHLATYVGKYIVSTVGEWRYNQQNPQDFKEIGYNRKYETMVFKAEPSKHKCCPYHIVVAEEVDFAGYNTADDAYAGHLEMCEKWAKPKGA